jgi:hypothetical protein
MDEDRCPTCGRSVHEASPSTRLESGDESIVGKNLTWALGLVAVLYMLVKVFLVARGDSAVARSLAGAVGVNSLVSGVMVAGLPDLACLLLLVSALWIAFDLFRQRKPATAVIALGGISWVVGMLTAPRSQIGTATLTAVLAIFLLVFFSVFTSNFGVRAQLIRPFVVPFVLLVAISIPMTVLNSITANTILLVTLSTACVISGWFLLFRMAIRNWDSRNRVLEFLRLEWRSILTISVLFLVASGPILWLHVDGAFAERYPTIFYNVWPRSFLAFTGLLGALLTGVVLGLVFPRVVALSESNLIPHQHRVVTFLITVIVGIVGLSAVAMTAFTGLAEVMSGRPWLPIEVLCINGVQQSSRKGSEGSGFGPGVVLVTTSESCDEIAGISSGASGSQESRVSIRGLVAYVLADDGRWMKILTQDRRVVSIPSRDLASRKLCSPTEDEFKGIKFGDRPILGYSRGGSPEFCPTDLVDSPGWFPSSSITPAKSP